MRAEKTADTAIDHLTLNDLVASIEEMAMVDENVLVSFKNRLALVGYDPSDERSNQPYLVHRLEGYKVEGEGFPRIRRSQVHTAVSDGNYQLSIPALQQWSFEID